MKILNHTGLGLLLFIVTVSLVKSDFDWKVITMVVPASLGILYIWYGRKN